MSRLDGLLAMVAALAISSCEMQCGNERQVSPGRPAVATIPPAPKSGVVPRTKGPITIDGNWKELDWQTTSCLYIQLRRQDGDLARPYSEVRFLHDDTMLYVGVYAADIDITSTDAFDLDVGPLHERLFASGKVEPADPDIKIAAMVDGKIDDPKGKDEEWKLEVAIPLAKTGLAPGKAVDAGISRCDTPKDGIRYCGDWGGLLSLQ